MTHKLLLKDSKGTDTLPNFFERGFCVVKDGNDVFTNIPGFPELNNLPHSSHLNIEKRLARYLLTHYVPEYRDNNSLIDEFSKTFVKPTLTEGGMIPNSTIKDWLFDHGKNNELVDS